jgi:hypothetical protein
VEEEEEEELPPPPPPRSNHDRLAKSHTWCVKTVADGGGATRIAQAIGEGDIGWWARDDQQVDWALCCLARNLVAEGAIMDFCRLVDHDAEQKLDLMTRIMTIMGMSSTTFRWHLPESWRSGSFPISCTSFLL